MTKKNIKKPKKNKAEMTDQEKELLTMQHGFIFGGSAYALLSFYTMHMGAACMEQSKGLINAPVEPNIFNDTFNGLDHMLGAPLDIFPITDVHMTYWGTMTLFASLYAAWKYTQYQRMKSDMEGKTHGSAKWNTNYKGYANKYTYVVGTHNDTELQRFYKKFVKEKVSEEEENRRKYCIDMNIIITEKHKLSFDNKWTRRNTNFIILGGSGTGKSFSFISPNIAQLNSSYIITDPSGELFMNHNKHLRNNGYDVKVLNLQEPEKGNRYNPFDYIKRKPNGECDQTSVMKMVAAFLDGAKGNSAKEEQFWRDSAEALLCSAAFYLIENMPYQNSNGVSNWSFKKMSEIVRMAKIEASSTSSETPYDAIMKEAGRKNPYSMAYSFYQTFRLANQKTAESILVSTDVKLAKFNMKEINELTTTDLENLDNNINLNSIADKKTALFIITPTGGGPFDFIASMLYNQMFDLLYNKGGFINPTRYHIYNHYGYPVETMFKTKEEANDYAERMKHMQIKEELVGDKTVYYLYQELENGEKKFLFERIPDMSPDMLKLYKPRRLSFNKKQRALNYIDEFSNITIKNTGNSLPWAVTCLFDEFNNIGEIPKFDEILATCRKYNINISVVLQNLAQLKGKYKDAWNTILGNCDNFLFLGGIEYETCEYVSKILGDATIKGKNASRSSAKPNESNYSFSAMARKLLQPNEIANLDNEYCIYVMRGELPYKVKKTNFKKHPHYAETGGGNEAMITTVTEMEQMFKRKKKRHKAAVKLKKIQAAQKPTELNSEEAVMDMTNTYTKEQTKDAIIEGKANKGKEEKVTEVEVKDIQSVIVKEEKKEEKVKKDVKVDDIPDGTSTWMFE